MKIKQLLLTTFIAATVSVLAVFTYSRIDKNSAQIVQVPADQPVQLAAYPPSGVPADLNFTFAAQKTIHGVVHVKTQSMREEMYYNPLYDFFFGDGYQKSYQQPVMSSGSGVIISTDGFIVTNNHVVQDANYIYVTLNDKRTYEAELVGRDPTTDIALLKVDETSLPYIDYGNSDEIQIGEWVLAVGNPFNLTSTVTAGIVSAKARNINILAQQFAIESFIQTDAAVNPGNSGGALVNNKGELLGINTAIASRTGSYVGYSFAVPVNIVKKIVSDLIEFGEVQRAYIGINIQDIDAEKANEIGLDEIKGVYVAGTVDGGAANEAGIKTGDVLLYVGQKAVNSMSELQEQISRFRPGDKVDVTINRENELKNFSIVLRNKHGNTNVVKTKEGEVFGAMLIKVEEKDLRRYRIRYGVQVTRLEEGRIKDSGIEEGFIITSINKQGVSNVDEAIEILNNVNGGVFIEGVYPNGKVAYFVLEK
jgi:serine protease Do